MHHLLPLKIKIGIVVVLASIVSGATSLLGFDRLSLSAIVGVVQFIVIYLLLRSWPNLARLPRLIPRPTWMQTDLSGKWVGQIRSQWQSAPDAPLPPPIPAILDLQQGWSEVVFSLTTDKMRSRSTGAVPTYDPTTGELRFRYFYETEPTAAANADNPPQRLGSALASIRLSTPDAMSIRYTNERSPGGDIELRRSLQPRVR